MMNAMAVALHQGVCFAQATFGERKSFFVSVSAQAQKPLTII
jgi:hypothetical protein